MVHPCTRKCFSQVFLDNKKITWQINILNWNWYITTKKNWKKKNYNLWILPETCLGIFNIYFFKNISNCKMENVTTLSYCHWAMKITALIITYRQCFNFVMTLLHRMVYSVQFWRPSFSWSLSASLHLTLSTKQTHTSIPCWKSLSHINIHFTFEPTDNIIISNDF